MSYREWSGGLFNNDLTLAAIMCGPGSDRGIWPMEGSVHFASQLPDNQDIHMCPVLTPI